MGDIFLALNRFVDVPVMDPDDARRRKLLNIIVGGVGVLSLFLIIVNNLNALFNPKSTGVLQINLIGLIILVVSAAFYAVNRMKRFPGWIVSSAFLLFLTIAIAFSDTPNEVSSGRSLFVFVLPIIMASVLLAPSSTFIFSFISSITIALLALSIDKLPNSPAIVGFFLISLISWLSSRSLEQALKEVRVINAELDKRVIERTQELSESLAREAAQASQREAILNSIADGVVVFDNNGTAIVSNPSMTALTGKSQDAIVGHGFTELLRSDELQADQQARISNIFTHQGDVPTFRINWGNKTLSVNAAEVRNAMNNAIGTVAVFRDVTREAELEKMKDTFVAVVSHELRTPLNAILGFAEMIKETVYGPVSESQTKASVRIMENTRRLLSIVSELLDQAQIQSGRMKINAEPCSPSELLKSLQDTMERISTDKEVQLVTEFDPQMPETLIGDPQRLQQIMINLANNAVKFTNRGGEVRVSVRKVDQDFWQIQVRDTGQGIPQEAQDYIFDTFRQVESSATRKYGGVGLGLAIVKQLVELMKGRITLDSQVGVGSVFTVTLPLITK
jgi:PAS domain S-box-containing protein